MSTANPTGTPSPQGSRVSLADGAAEDIRSRMGKRPRKSTNESLTGSQDDTISLNEFRSPFWWIETIPFPKHDLKPLSARAKRLIYWQLRTYAFFKDPVTRPRIIYQISLYSFLIVSILISLSLSGVGSQREFLRVFSRVCDIILFMLFTMEYIVTGWACVCQPQYRHPVKGRLKYYTTGWLILDLCTLILSVLSIVNGSNFGTVVRLFRLIQLTKLFRLDDQLDTMTTLQEIWSEYKMNFLVASFLSLIMLLLSAALIFTIEGGPGPTAEDPDGEGSGMFPSAGIAMWWAIITSSTIGYGDVYPTTAGGRLIGVALAWVGVAFFAIPAGILSSAFALKVEMAGEIKARQVRKEGFAVDTISTWWHLRSLQARSPHTMDVLNSKVVTMQKRFFNDVKAAMASADSFDVARTTHTQEYGKLMANPYYSDENGEPFQPRDLNGVPLEPGPDDQIRRCFIFLYMLGCKLSLRSVMVILDDAISEREVGVADVLNRTADMDVRLSKTLKEVNASQAKLTRNLKNKMAKYDLAMEKMAKQDVKIDSILQLLEEQRATGATTV